MCIRDRLIGLSTLITILIGGFYVINGQISIGVIGEFVMYILMLTFPVMAIGWTASMIQRAATSQRRINEFLQTEPTIVNEPLPGKTILRGNFNFDKGDFFYPHTGNSSKKDFKPTIK